MRSPISSLWTRPEHSDSSQNSKSVVMKTSDNSNASPNGYKKWDVIKTITRVHTQCPHHKILNSTRLRTCPKIKRNYTVRWACTSPTADRTSDCLFKHLTGHVIADEIIFTNIDIWLSESYARIALLTCMSQNRTWKHLLRCCCCTDSQCLAPKRTCHIQEWQCQWWKYMRSESIERCSSNPGTTCLSSPTGTRRAPGSRMWNLKWTRQT